MKRNTKIALVMMALSAMAMGSTSDSVAENP